MNFTNDFDIAVACVFGALTVATIFRVTVMNECHAIGVAIHDLLVLVPKLVVPLNRFFSRWLVGMGLRLLEKEFDLHVVLLLDNVGGAERQYSKALGTGDIMANGARGVHETMGLGPVRPSSVCGLPPKRQCLL